MGASKNPTTAVGDILYASAANTGAPATLARLAAGTDGKYLRSKGNDAPQWDTADTVASNISSAGMTYEKIGTVTNARVLGRASGGTGGAN